MKLRAGFISNSSSSSYVVVGYMIDDDGISAISNIVRRLFPTEVINSQDELFDLLYEQDKYFIGWNSDHGTPSGKILVGHLISDISSECPEMQNNLIPFAKIEEIIKELHTTLGGLYLDKMPCIYAGTRSC